VVKLPSVRVTSSLIAGVALLLVAVRAQTPTAPVAAQSSRSATPVDQRPAEKLEVPPPPFSEGIFPCTACHALLPVNTKRRELQFHTEIQAMFNHDSEHRWCLDCHDPTNRDVLHLADGTRIPFDESYLLCGQCHGEKLRDWRAGVHGRRTGSWNGDKQYLLCVHCHIPHAPKFRPLEPKPAPVKPTRPGGGK
jgi:hypothetical protein